MSATAHGGGDDDQVADQPRASRVARRGASFGRGPRARAAGIALCVLFALWSPTSLAGPPPAGSASPPADSASPPSSVPGTSRQKTPAVPLRPSQRSADPARVSGLERKAVEPGDAARTFGTAVLYPFRKFVELQFWLADASVKVARALELGPRAHAFFSPKPGELKLLPTLFFESRHPVSFGARAIALLPTSESSISLSSGGPHDVTAKSRVVLSTKRPLAGSLTLEALYDSRNDLELLGVGQAPETDARNVFRPGVPHDGRYLERRSRALVSLDLAILRGFSVVPSTSLLLDRVDDAPGSGAAGLSQVFAPTSFIESAAVTRLFYSELAVRYFTRRSWAGADPGVQLEGYGGYATGSAGTELRYVTAGGRAALFVPVTRPSNTLSPKLVLDGMVPVAGDVPFTVLVRQVEFRGFDLRCDRLSLIASLDYRWVFVRYVAARLFVDAATVAPRFGDLVASPPRFAAGFGFDIFGSREDLARFAFAGSADGLRILVSLGPTAASGDRQRRN